MQNIDIKNPRVLALLDHIRYLYREKYDVTKTNNMIGSWDDDSQYWIGDSFRDKIISQGRDHNGSPDRARSYAIKPDHYNGEDPQYEKDYVELDSNLKFELGLKTNALCQLYPPEGFIGWHNNANAEGYNLIFTWSETGDGWFKYVDKYGKGDIITIPDKKGWSCKAGYFGSYEDKRLCYHAAYTKCWRITQSFIVSQDEDYWKDCLDYISEE